MITVRELKAIRLESHRHVLAVQIKRFVLQVSENIEILEVQKVHDEFHNKFFRTQRSRSRNSASKRTSE